jgi:hypothetical protein
VQVATALLEGFLELVEVLAKLLWWHRQHVLRDLPRPSVAVRIVYMWVSFLFQSSIPLRPRSFENLYSYSFVCFGWQLGLALSTLPLGLLYGKTSPTFFSIPAFKSLSILINL